MFCSNIDYLLLYLFNGSVEVGLFTHGESHVNIGGICKVILIQGAVSLLRLTPSHSLTCPSCGHTNQPQEESCLTSQDPSACAVLTDDLFEERISLTEGELTFV